MACSTELFTDNKLNYLIQTSDADFSNQHSKVKISYRENLRFKTLQRNFLLKLPSFHYNNVKNPLIN